jgi:hypothetical protein
MGVQKSSRLGRRVDHVLVDQSVFAWTHRILGIVSGLTLVFAMIASGDLVLHRLTWLSTHAFSYRAAFMFGVGALPLAISYFENRNRVDDSVPRTAIFLMLVGLVSFGVDGLVVYLVDGSQSIQKVLLLFAAQAALYLGLGARVLNAGFDANF